MELHVARKVRIADIVNGKFSSTNSGGYVVTPLGLRVIKARILATIVVKFMSADGRYGYVVLDDGSATIRAKVFGSLEPLSGINEGDLVDVVGQLRTFKGEIYILPEIIQKLSDPNWLTLRELELNQQERELLNIQKSLKELDEASASEMAKKAGLDMSVINKARAEKEKDREREEKIIKLISELDSGDGVSYKDIVKKSGMGGADLDEMISKLLKSGKCYEPKPGQIKVV
jgi:RPA family protein